jgi:hypothetical protein
MATEEKVSGLGVALTQLGLEKKFISTGEIFKFPLSERGVITESILSEKLKQGKWDDVVDFMYGPSRVIDSLYGGDRNKLREDIVKSAVEHSKSNPPGSRIITLLEKAQQHDILFDLAIKTPLRYDDFMEVRRSIEHSDYLGRFENRPEKEKALDEVNARLAMDERHYNEALGCFVRAGDQAGIDTFFEKTLNPFNITDCNVSTLEQAAISDPKKKESRLKSLVKNFSAVSSGPAPLVALELKKKYNLKLDEDENKSLSNNVATKIDQYDLEKGLPQDETEIELSWAKLHARKEPKKAYKIFTKHNYDGNELYTAILEGITPKRDNPGVRAINFGEVKESQLKKLLEMSPSNFEVKSDIALHLKDATELMKLYKEAKKDENFEDAYKLFMAAGGNPQDENINDIRNKLISQKIEKGEGVYFLDSSDRIGETEFYNQLLESYDGKDIMKLRHAYEIAKGLKNEKMTQRVRELMIANSPSWALSTFNGHGEKNEGDKAGMDYLLTVVSNSTGADKKQLESLVSKWDE